MKNIFSVLLFIFLSSTVSFGQKDAKKIIDDLKKEYLGYANYSIEFTLLYDMPESEDISYEGILSEEGDKYALKLGDRRIFCDGENVWLYLPENNECQINTFDKDEDSLLSPKSFLKKDIDGEFNYRISSENSKSLSIEFVPKIKNDDFFKVRIEVDKSKNQITKIIAFHSDAVRTILSIKSVKHDVKMPASKFVFNKDEFPGVRIEDLRL